MLRELFRRPMRCCANCFGDQYLESAIFPNRSKERGKCFYCGSNNQKLLAPTVLQEDFEPLIDIYEGTPDGRLLVDWIRDDWAMFEQMENTRANDLLAQILNDSEIVRKGFARLDCAQSDTPNQWAKLRAELKHQNRFFPRSELDLGRFKQLLPYLRKEAGTVSSKWYRARIQPDDKPFTPQEMGAPPQKLATHGRANPAGIPYLYLASDRETAVSEIRPHTGEVASVAEFVLQGPMKIVDLQRPRKTISPFLLSRDEVALDVGDIGFLEQLGQELTFPVLPQSAAFDYIPTQYLCEFIKDCDFQGVLYRSAVGEGVNLALFEPSCADVGVVKSVEVEQVTVRLADEN